VMPRITYAASRMAAVTAICSRLTDACRALW
jgi:hypothetical protein